MCYNHKKVILRGFNQMDKVKLMKIITVSAIIFIAVMVVALVINLVKLSNVNSKKAALEKELKEIQRQIEENNSEIEYISTDEYIDQYAREYLNMHGKDEEAFTGSGE